jgi:hypothetical protein
MKKQIYRKIIKIDFPKEIYSDYYVLRLIGSDNYQASYFDNYKELFYK